MTNLADPRPITASVDILGCRDSNRFSDVKITSSPDGTISCKDSKLLGENGSFSYRWVGVTDGGIHVIETALCTGGSGIFETVLLARITKESYWNYDKIEERMILKSVGEIGLGDRSSTHVEVRGSTVVLTKEEQIFQIDHDMKKVHKNAHHTKSKSIKVDAE
jgi:hypothetical protein